MAKNIIFADIEAYSLKYFLKYGRVDAYIIGGEYMYSDEQIVDTTIIGFLRQIIAKRESATVFFHNGSGYDFHFILPVLYENFNENNINLFIDEKKKIFKIALKCKYKENGKQHKFTITFKDTYKLWPYSLAALGSAIGMEKLDYGDYDIMETFDTVEDYKNHNGGKSYEYFIRDIQILKKFAIDSKDILPLESYKLTIASTAKSLWKESNPTYKMVDTWIDSPELWTIIQNVYRGGFTWNNPKFQMKKLNDIYVYDVNSLYPSVMLNDKLPYGKVSYDDKETHTYKIYMVYITKAKAKKFPFIPHQGNHLREDTFALTYPYELEDEYIFLNNYELEYFSKMYEGEWEPEFLCNFKERYDVFEEYIPKWENIKKTSNGAVRLLAKLFLNSVYGKFAQSIKEVDTEILKYDEIKDKIKKTKKQEWYNDKVVTKNDGIAYIKRNSLIKEDSGYIVMAEAISSKARLLLYDAIDNNWENFVYCDTDSIHLTKPAEGIELHKSNFGAWDFEGKWDQGVYRRPKHYLHVNNNGDYELKGGGFNVNHFNKTKEIGIDQYLQHEFEMAGGKIISEIVDGGVLLYETNYKFTMPKSLIHYKEQLCKE